MPVIIVDGFYRTDEGFPVKIHAIGSTEKATFNAKGNIYKKNKGFHINPEFNIWRSKDGSNMAVRKSCRDLVEITEAEWNQLIEKK